MIDKSIPYFPLTMYKTDPEVYPHHALPEGFSFVFYRAGDEARWAEIEVSVGQFASMEDAVACFRREFLQGQMLDPTERMLFVVDAAGEYVGTATLWDGMFLGERLQRIHWVAVKDKCAGRGIAKAMLSRLMALYHELGYQGTMYLLTGTRNYPAVAIYRRFGFVSYTGPRSLSDKLTDGEFTAQAEQAVRIIEEKWKR